MKIIKSRIFKILIIALIVGFVLGIISFMMVDKDNITNNITNYINLIKTGKFNYSVGLIKSLYNNFKYSFLIWIFGILFIFSLFSIIIIAFKSAAKVWRIIGIQAAKHETRYTAVFLLFRSYDRLFRKHRYSFPQHLWLCRQHACTFSAEELHCCGKTSVFSARTAE